MHILLVPSNNSSSNRTCLHHRQIVLLGLIFLMVLPVALGLVAYQVRSTLDRMNNPQLDADYLARLEQSLVKQRAEINDTKQTADNHLNALALRLGKIQAQVMRINALGQRLTSMAGLTRGEFDFSISPGVGGAEPPAGTPVMQLPSLATSLERLSFQVEQRFQELELLESLLMDHQLQAALKPVGWPVIGGYVSSAFGYRQDPFTGRRASHKGVDIANRRGAPVKALASGVVTHAGKKRGYGMVVEVNHGNGYMTRYAHTSANLVKMGDKIEKGQKIALVGSSGRSTGPHLHFEILHNGRAINPRTYLRAKR
ncbi:MAG: M23 family metallopeptidase [Gammaproteobacteria bacterium]|nr:M23 family metallopeptidase [Gammaproteobacteria bacterium]